jgi:MYXO-CTERM domain-containing protein
MADGSPAGPADGLTPEQEEVRRLLADARHLDPMPHDVAGRLDRVLAGLAQGPDDGPDAGPGATPAAGVVSLAARRRRRAATALVAAAAAVAVGIGLGQVVGTNGSGAEDASVSASRTQQEGGALDRSRPHQPRTRGHAPQASSPVVPFAHRIRPQHFATDVRRVRGPLSRLDTPAESTDGALHQLAACTRDHAAAGSRSVPVRYGRRDAVLVFRRVTGHTQVVDLFRCGGSEPLRSVRLPAP